MVRALGRAAGATVTCSVCGRESAPNWGLAGDERCGPCHNFGLVGFEGPYAVLVRRDFGSWVDEQVRQLVACNNVETYRPWLHALKLAHERRLTELLATSEQREAPP